MDIMSSLWTLVLSALGILDVFLFKKPAAADQPNIGPMIWGISILVLGGLFGLWNLFGLSHLTSNRAFITDYPLIGLYMVASVAIKLGLSVLLLLGGISRLQRRAPRMGALKMIFGILLVVLALTGPVLFHQGTRL